MKRALVFVAVALLASAPNPGTFRIELDIEDKNAGKTTTYTQAVVIEP